MVAPKGQSSTKMKAMVAQPADVGKMQAADETNKQADAFEEEITALKVKYDQYFLGLERFEPIKEREDLKARLNKFKATFIRNTGVRFRVQSQFQKFLSLERMWLRIAKEIEDGTYTRDLFKARMRGEKRKKKAEGKKKGEAFDLSAEEEEQAAQANGVEVPEPKTDPHLVIPAELRARGAPATSDDPPLVMPAPLSAPSPTSKTDPLPALVMPKPAGKAPPPPPPPAPAVGAKAPPKPPPPPPPGSSAPPSRVTGSTPALVAPAKPSGPQPAVVSKTTGPQPAVKSPPVSPGASGVMPKVSPPPPPSSASSGGNRGLPPPPPGSSGVRPPPPPPSAQTNSGVRPPAAKPAGSMGNPALGEDKMKAIYSAYMAAKRQCKESTDGITYDSVAKTINTQVPELMKQHNAKAVDFKVVIKNGKATLKAVPKV